MLDTEVQTSQTPPQAAPASSPPAMPTEEEYASFTPEQRKAFRDAPSPAPAAAPREEPKTNGANGHDTDDKEPGEINVGDDGRVRDSKGRFVPYEALGKERSKRKETEAELTKEREERAKLTGRVDELSKVLGLLDKIVPKKEEPQAAPEAPKEIDPDEDVIGAIKDLVGWRKEVSKKFQETDTERQAAIERQSLVNRYSEDIKSAMSELPDLKDAYDHVKKVQTAVLTAQGITDPNIVKNLLDKAEEDFVRAAHKNKANAARGLYAIAQAQGYQPKKAGGAAPAAAAPAKTDAERKIEAVKEGMAAAGSLSGASGGAPPVQYDLARMSEDEFTELRGKLSKAEWRKLMGG